MKPVDEEIDLLAIYCVGGRLSKQKSRALPREAYGDPAKSIKFENERKKKPRGRG